MRQAIGNVMRTNRRSKTKTKENKNAEAEKVTHTKYVRKSMCRSMFVLQYIIIYNNRFSTVFTLKHF